MQAKIVMTIIILQIESANMCYCAPHDLHFTVFAILFFSSL